MSMHSTYSAVAQRFTVADLHSLGQRNGFVYRLPNLDIDSQNCQSLCIAEGRIQEFSLLGGSNLVLSDITVHEPYEATSVHTPQLCVIVMLQGQARLAIMRCGQEQWIASSGISALYSDVTPMTGYHPAGQRLQSVNLSFSVPSATGDERLADMFDKTMRQNGFGLRGWKVPPFLTLSLMNLLKNSLDEPVYRLFGEGVGLQLLAHALGELGQPVEPDSPLSARDVQRLERVREHLYDAPGEEHTLVNLARLAYMSPSALRAKFQMAYNRSVFSYLRERRLEVAYAKLAQGCSVQQAAHSVGYRHATNFSTALRQHYGVSPSELH